MFRSDPKWQRQQLGLLVRRPREMEEEVQTHGAVRIYSEDIKEGREAPSGDV
ncbi:Beta-galactosidase [Clarias magur]|uniref:Beta-galactosidase n=1 Tax=Clarias magur TaxID=1594786 RepID=A0A8J4UEB1_CLAMG|nr:Beta-galactosidase [Clarias magur]